MNQKDHQIVDRFIELRSQGWTFHRIATELNVSKPTLIAWSRKFAARIRNLRALETETLVEQSNVSRRNCLENLAEDSRRIREELAKRDLAGIPTARLLSLAALLRAEAGRLNGPVLLSETITDDIPDPLPDPAVAWEA